MYDSVQQWIPALPLQQWMPALPLQYGYLLSLYYTVQQCTTMDKYSWNHAPLQW